ncbi:flagellar motor protein MotD, partial [Oleiphilus sp. HI0130]
YADFITLLFAFFVVMYSISSVNEGKYKVLSDSLEGIFNTRPKSLEPIQIGELNDRTERQAASEGINPILIGRQDSYESIKEKSDDVQLESIAGEFEESFEDLIYEDQLSVRVLDDWVEISLRDEVVFQSGGVIPAEEAFEVIKRISGVLRSKNNGVLIEGHTDNLRINNSQFPSNWELSVARAATFLRLLSIEGIDEGRMAAIGYGQYRPLVRNDTPQGRRENRRIVLLISRSGDVRQSLIE